ncbi:TIGR02556 family CRISPR-associated protein [Methanoregula formicica]|uniref:CRISPR-associated protein, TM1802 family n=1 Tax=Methanoregula formicica (strain DSM 22288 / NBRC 105244 / SMSP) TaxID=593750 RepID=L0HGP1_METFS|nr:TIGR02556 family CRISPR-associated protein [Methanoregula formicica]AGB03160.1 CRISPR-associated protein, TM1802 family [Methanoregula formicica SMSP]
MIEAIREIGEYANKGAGDNLLDNFSKKIPLEIKKKKQHVIIFNFDTTNQTITCDYEEVKPDSGKKYLWLGNNPRNKPQIYFTSDVFPFIFGDAISNILERVDNPLKNELQMVLEKFFIAISYKEKKDERKIWRVDFTKFSLPTDLRPTFSEKNKELLKELSSPSQKKDQAKKNSKKYLEALSKNILTSLKSKLASDDVSIYTIKLNGSSLAARQEYRKMLSNEKIGCLFDPKDTNYKKYLNRQGNCSLCNKKNIATTSTATNLSFKYYMTDKLGFSSDLDGKFTRNFNICETCYGNLLSGEAFIKNNLKIKIGKLNGYVIPTLLFKNLELDYARFARYITHKNNAVSNLTVLHIFEKELKNFRDFEENEKNNFVINYLFYRSEQGRDFKILRLIKDVPPSRLDTILDIQQKIALKIDKGYPVQQGFLKISLKSLYYTIPIRIGNKDRTYSTKFLDIIDAVFASRSIDYSLLIDQYTELLRIIFHNRGGYNVSSESHLWRKVLQQNFALVFFRELNLLRGFTMEKVSDIGSVPVEINKFWSDIGVYDDPRKTLFLLGYLIGGIGNKQWKAGHKNKPILNKINFEGMNVQAIIRLTNEVFEKLVQYKILKLHESLFYEYKKMIDIYSQSWNLSNQENVFYILSGYSFATYQAISRGEQEAPTEQETEEDEGGDTDE